MSGQQLRIASTCALVFLLAMGGATPGIAQELPYGAWTGTMTPPARPDGQPSQPISVSYEVGELDGTLTVVMRALMVQEIIRFYDVSLAGDELRFWWEPGTRVDCTLRRTASGSYEGPCAAGSGGAGALTMIPPAGTPR